jgi:hypothetical protein
VCGVRSGRAAWAVSVVWVCVRGVAELKWDVCSQPAVSVGPQRKQVRRASRRAEATATSNVPVTVTVPGECSNAQVRGSCGLYLSCIERDPGRDNPVAAHQHYSPYPSPSAAPSPVATGRTPQNTGSYSHHLHITNVSPFADHAAFAGV